MNENDLDSQWLDIVCVDRFGKSQILKRNVYTGKYKVYVDNEEISLQTFDSNGLACLKRYGFRVLNTIEGNA